MNKEETKTFKQFFSYYLWTCKLGKLARKQKPTNFTAVPAKTTLLIGVGFSVIEILFCKLVGASLSTGYSFSVAL